MSKLFTLFLNSSGPKSDTSGPADTNSTPDGTLPVGSAANSSSTALRRRRNRLRCTAPPTRLVMAKATRVLGAASDSRRWTIPSGPRRTRTPSARSAAKVRRSRTGSIKPTAWPGLSRVGCATRHDRRGSTCACGTHGSWPSCGRWAGMCASRILLLSSATGTPQAAIGDGR
jgi:hypothetical protein